VRRAVDHAHLWHRAPLQLLTATANSAIKEEKPVVALIRTLLRCVASAIQVTRPHDLLTRFSMITFSHSIQPTHFLPCTTWHNNRMEQ
jgi:hypothetical protein